MYLKILSEKTTELTFSEISKYCLPSIPAVFYQEAETDTYNATISISGSINGGTMLAAGVIAGTNTAPKYYGAMIMEMNVTITDNIE